MTPELIDLLPAMVVFAAVARAKSFSVAAKLLQMPVSTVSRQVSELEQRLRLQLLTRSTRQVTLTSAGEAYYRRCADLIEAADAAHAELRGFVEHPRGQLRVSVSPDFAITFLSELFFEFARRYPEIAFDFDLSTRTVDVLTEGYDLALRIGVLPDSQLTARKLGTVGFWLYAAPAYLASAGPLDRPEHLGAHECLHLLPPDPRRTTWPLQSDEQQLEVAIGGRRFVANSVRFLTQLAVLGLGVAALAEPVAEPEVRAGRLVRVLPAWHPPSLPLHALLPTKLLPARTKLFLDWLSAHSDLWTRPGAEGAAGSVARSPESS